MQPENKALPTVDKPRKKRRRVDAEGNPAEEREERLDRLG